MAQIGADDPRVGLTEGKLLAFFTKLDALVEKPESRTAATKLLAGPDGIKARTRADKLHRARLGALPPLPPATHQVTAKRLAPTYHNETTPTTPGQPAERRGPRRYSVWVRAR